MLEQNTDNREVRSLSTSARAGLGVLGAVVLYMGVGTIYHGYKDLRESEKLAREAQVVEAAGNYINGVEAVVEIAVNDGVVQAVLTASEVVCDVVYEINPGDNRVVQDIDLSECF